jgi:hypothetical protein
MYKRKRSTWWQDAARSAGGAYGLAKRMRQLAKRTGLPMYDSSLSNPKKRRVSTVKASTKRRRTPYPRKPLKSYAWGSYRGRFKRPIRAVKSPNYYTTGAVSKYESGSVQAGADVVYVGHSNNACNVVFHTVWMAIIKEVMYKAGYQVQSPSQPLGGMSGKTVELTVKMTGVTNTSTTSVSYTCTANDDLYAVTINLLTNLFSTRPATAWQTVLPVSIFLRSGVGDQLAHLPLRQSLIQLECWSLMTIQNRTLAAGGTTTEVDESALSVTNNPISGKVYRVRGNGFVPTYQVNADASFTPLFADKNTGLFSTNAADSFPDSKKIPQPFYFGAKYSRNVTLQPGEIKKDFIKSYSKMKLETFMTKFCNQITNEAQTTPLDELKIDWGESSMYAFEKVCNTRADEPQISVGFEVNNTVKAKLITRRLATEAYMVA